MFLPGLIVYFDKVKKPPMDFDPKFIDVTLPLFRHFLWKFFEAVFFTSLHSKFECEGI